MSAIRTIKRKTVHLHIRNKHYKYTEIIEEIISANVNEVVDLTADIDPVQTVQTVQSPDHSSENTNTVQTPDHLSDYEDINSIPTPDYIAEYGGYASPHQSGNISDISTDSAPENVHE